jgi:hypothetical protein
MWGHKKAQIVLLLEQDDVLDDKAGILNEKNLKNYKKS